MSNYTSWVFEKSSMEMNSNPHKQGKNDQRQNQPGENYFLADIYYLRVTGDLDAGAAELCADADYVVEDEDKGEILGPHAGQVFCV